MPGLADGHQRGDRVADDRQTHEAVEPLRHTGQLERQRGDLAPVAATRQGRVGQDRYGEGLVFAVAAPQRRNASLPIDVGLGSRKRPEPSQTVRSASRMAATPSIVVATLE